MSAPRPFNPSPGLMTKAGWLVGLCLQGLFDVLWYLVCSSYEGYLTWMQVMELRVLSKPHEARHVLFDQEIGQLPPADFVSVLLPHHLGVAASFVPAGN
jgi:hypothetical protein